MISIKNLQKSFSKAYIALCDGCITVSYVSSEESKWATQCFCYEDSTKEVLEAIISGADSLSISVSREYGVKLEFLTAEKSGFEEMFIYFPTEHDITEQELAEILGDREDELSPKMEELLDRLSGVDLSDEDTVFNIVFNWLGGFEDKESTISYEGLSHLTSLLEKASEFSEKFKFGLVDVLRPATDWDGCVILSTAVSDGNRFWNFTGESREMLLDLVSDATEVDIECGSNGDGEILNITFYA